MNSEQLFRLNADWTPRGHLCITWFALDKRGRIAILTNHGFGELPRCLLGADGIEPALDALLAFMCEESTQHDGSTVRKGGDFSVGCYSSWFYRGHATKQEVEATLRRGHEARPCSDVNFAVNKGMYAYVSLDHGNIENEYPVGYDAEVSNGDYFQFLLPTEFSSITDIPRELRGFIPESRTLAFADSLVLNGTDIMEQFPRLYVDPC